jgi:CcmD family protein
MRSVVKKLAFVWLVVLCVLSGSAITAQTPAQEGFVPVDQLEGQEQLPAAPLVAAAYGVAWAAVLVYLWTIWRRLGKVEQELVDVSRRLQSGGRR